MTGTLESDPQAAAALEATIDKAKEVAAEINAAGLAISAGTLQVYARKVREGAVHA